MSTILEHWLTSGLAACTCPGESHPGPVKPNGEYVGRSAPEIDILEAIVEGGEGHASQSAQFAPFNAHYQARNDSEAMTFYDLDKSKPNPYMGGALQQCTSGLSVTNQTCYELSGGCFTEFGFDYKPGSKDGYVTWLNSGTKAWTLRSDAMVADPLVEISERPIPQEPLVSQATDLLPRYRVHSPSRTDKICLTVRDHELGHLRGLRTDRLGEHAVPWYFERRLRSYLPAQERCQHWV